MELRLSCRSRWSLRQCRAVGELWPVFSQPQRKRPLVSECVLTSKLLSQEIVSEMTQLHAQDDNVIRGLGFVLWPEPLNNASIEFDKSLPHR